MVQPLWRTVWKVLKHLKKELPSDSAIPLLGIYPKKMKTLTQKDIWHPHVHSSTSFNSQDVRTT